MRRYIQSNRLLVSLILTLFPLFSMAQKVYPENNGDKVRYNIQIDIRKAYLSGICILSKQEDCIISSIVNEFGVSLMDFSYNPQKKKVKIHSITKKLDRWYIKRILKKDIKSMLEVMQTGGNEYIDSRYKIKYTFSLNNGFEGQPIYNNE